MDFLTSTWFVKLMNTGHIYNELVMSFHKSECVSSFSSSLLAQTLKSVFIISSFLASYHTFSCWQLWPGVSVWLGYVADISGGYVVLSLCQLTPAYSASLLIQLVSQPAMFCSQLEHYDLAICMSGCWIILQEFQGSLGEVCSCHTSINIDR